MSFPVALVLIALIAAISFERYLRSTFIQRKTVEDFEVRFRALFGNVDRVLLATEDLPELKEKVSLHEKAIKNLGDQTLSEISKIKDRMGTLQMAAGLRVKQESK